MDFNDTQGIVYLLEEKASAANTKEMRALYQYVRCLHMLVFRQSSDPPPGHYYSGN